MMPLVFQHGRGLCFFSAMLFLAACAGKKEIFPEGPLPVKAAPVTVRETAEEISGFGSLSFVKKQDISASQEGILERLYCREGDRVRKGDVTAVLKNPQLSLAAERALDAQAQAKAALDLAVSRLLEGRFQAEAAMLSLEKARLELAQAGKALEEQKRKHGNQESLYEAGALSEETIRDARFTLTAAEEKIGIMEKELEIQSIGFRDEDLLAAGLAVPWGEAASDVVYYERKERLAGVSKYPFRKMLKFAWEGVTSLSTKPIRMVAVSGALIFTVSIAMIVYFIAQYFTGRTVSGWPSMICSLWGIGGLILLSIGVVGEYVGKIYLEAKRRPRFIIEKMLTGGDHAAD